MGEKLAHVCAASVDVYHEQLLERGVHKHASVQLLEQGARIAVQLYDALKDAVGFVDDGSVGGAQLGVEGGMRGKLGRKGAWVGKVGAVEEQGSESVGFAWCEVVHRELLDDVQQRSEQGVATRRLDDAM